MTGLRCDLIEAVGFVVTLWLFSGGGGPVGGYMVKPESLFRPLGILLMVVPQGERLSELAQVI
jgi:hypothetical protein